MSKKADERGQPYQCRRTKTTQWKSATIQELTATFRKKGAGNGALLNSLSLQGEKVVLGAHHWGGKGAAGQKKRSTPKSEKLLRNREHGHAQTLWKNLRRKKKVNYKKQPDNSGKL